MQKGSEWHMPQEYKDHIDSIRKDAIESIKSVTSLGVLNACLDHFNLPESNLQQTAYVNLMGFFSENKDDPEKLIELTEFIEKQNNRLKERFAAENRRIVRQAIEVGQASSKLIEFLEIEAILNRTLNKTGSLSSVPVTVYPSQWDQFITPMSDCVGREDLGGNLSIQVLENEGEKRKAFIGFRKDDKGGWVVGYVNIYN